MTILHLRILDMFLRRENPCKDQNNKDKDICLNNSSSKSEHFNEDKKKISKMKKLFFLG